MYKLRLSRRARLSIGGAALTLTATAGGATLQVTAAEATTGTPPPASTVTGTPASTGTSGNPDVTDSTNPTDGPVLSERPESLTTESLPDTAEPTGPSETTEAPAEDAEKSGDAKSTGSKRSKGSTTATASKKSKQKTAKLSKTATQKIKAGRAVAEAKKQVGDPYRYGAAGPNAFDCSGLVQWSWKKAGISLPRVTTSQYARTKKKVSYSRLQPGDLLFFSGKGHVGMYVGHGKMIHSPSSGKTVRIEKLNGWRKASFSGAVRPGI